MPQTFLALAAIVLLTIFGFSQSQNSDALGRRAISEDLERAMTEAARDRMADISRRAFDEQDLTARGGVRTQPPTSAVGRDAGEATLAAFDDIDDFNDLAAVLGGPERRMVPVADGAVEIELVVSVQYVRADDPSVPSAAPTLAKEVVVSAREAAPTGGRPPVAASFRRVFTPAGLAVR